MDEIELVKELFAEPVPPSPEVVERAYARMVNQAGPGWARRSRNGAIALVAAASLAAAAVATVAVASRGAQDLAVTRSATRSSSGPS